jgi:hypothetical protein
MVVANESVLDGRELRGGPPDQNCGMDREEPQTLSEA